MRDAPEPSAENPSPRESPQPAGEPPPPEPADPQDVLPDLPPAPEVGRSIGQVTAAALREVRRVVVGGARNPLDPRIFHQVALIAFFAWVGLGADGLSSSAYGPEAAYLALGSHHGLAVLLAIATMLTVSIISASYFHIIDLFPTGGGGYLVATKLLGSGAGLVAGAALIIDYALTIAISLASGMDALFSLLPLSFHGYRYLAVFASVVILTALNLRGVKESIKILTPIFLLFIVTHAVLLTVGIFGAPRGLAAVPHEVASSVSESLATLGFAGTFLVLFRAYSLGAGTYTGIEAVSNGLDILREPRTATGKRTMVYMAVSLSLTAGGLLIAYLIHQVAHQPGRTLNATLATQVFAGWHAGAVPLGKILDALTLVSEGAILVVAAQTGFLSGPRVLANMALDKWVPRRFANLSERLVTQDGIILMAVIAAGVLVYTGTSVAILVVMYSINVFITFVLTQLGMVQHWVAVRGTERRWRRRLAVNGLGFLLCAAILVVMIALKFTQGGWVTLLVTGALIGGCWTVRRHYDRVERYTGRLNAILTALPVGRHAKEAPVFDPKGPTAVLLVSGFNGLGMHSFLSVLRLFPGHFKNFVFLSVGVLDFGKFKGVEEIESLKEATEQELARYVEHANGLGLWATARCAFGTEVIDVAAELCEKVAGEMPRPVFFAGRMIYRDENFASRSLHGQTALALQRRLHFAGIPFIILPIRAL